jgi:eukaryotic-like serine/threonine-protein kinase
VKTCTSCGREYADDVRFCPNDGTTLRAQAGSDLIGSVVADRYHISKKLGEGGMGAVYLGEHVKMGRKSAIKVIAQSMAEDADAIARFNREAANAARINHPNVCGIYDFGETDDGLIYLAMEFVEGQALTTVLDREGALAPKRAADILRQTADALQAAHDLGIVHRDLKPDNIMIAKGREGSDLVKVVDFGIAKAVGGDADQKVTKTGLVVGTPEYMSPEQLSGDALDGRSDIYSLGLVLFRMLTGELPFQGPSSQEVMIKRLTDQPLRLNDVVAGANFPPSLQAAMDHALQRMPADRYTSAAQFGRDVTAAVAEMGNASSRIDSSAATQIFGSQKPTAVQLPETRVSEPKASAHIPTKPTTPPTPMPQPSRDRQPPPKKKPYVAVAAAVAAVAIGGIGAMVWLNPGDSGSDRNDPGVVGVEDSSRNGSVLASNQQQRDTTSNQVENGGSHVPADTPTVVRGGTTRDTASRDTGRAGPEQPHGIVVSATNAAEHMLNLMLMIEGASPERATVMAVRDTALAYYDATGVPTKARADAAYVIANAYHALQNRAEALRWARLAASMDPSDSAYRTLVDALERGNS